MMSFGPMGGGAGGNSSSSSSNLSALAPPFTVDRLSPNPNSSTNMHYTNSPYAAEAYNHTWQYAPPSAPGPELVVNSTGISSVPLSLDYQFSASASLSPSSTHWSYGGDAKPYHSPYIPPVVGGGDGLFVEGKGSTSGLKVKSPIDLFDLECGPRWMDPLEFGDDGKRAKIIDWDGSFLPEKAHVGGLNSYNNQPNRGERETDHRNKSKEESTVPYKKFNQVSEREVYTGSLGYTHTEDKVCLEQIGFFPYDSKKSRNPASSSAYPETNPSVESSELHNNFSNYQNLRASYDKFVKPVDPPFTPMPVTRPSPTVVIRPPPAKNVNFGKTRVAHKPHVSRVDNNGGADNVDFELSNPSKRKDSGFKPSFEITQESVDMNLFNFSEQGNNPFSSAVLKEHPNDKGKFGSQLPDTNVTDCFTMACDNSVQAVNSAEDSSDFLDHEDSPCWKGAPSSRFSKLDVEASNLNLAKKNSEEYYVFDHQKHQNLHPIVASNEAFSEKVGQESKSIVNEFPLERSLDAICSGKEQSSMNVGISPNDVSEGGAVAVHAAENVLDSPASQEDALEHSKTPNPNLSVLTMIKAMHNLSELLLFHLSNDASSLEEEHTETFKQIISNIDSCLSKRTMPASNKQDSTSQKPGESLNVDKISGSPCITNKPENSPVKLDSQHMNVEGREYAFFGKKYESSPKFSSLTGELDITSADDMSEAIKKVLEDNFHLNEEMDSQSLLFKNLWLDAEAKICAMSYKARFDRMKIHMEEVKHKSPPQENEDIAELMSKFGISASELTPQANIGPLTTSRHADNNEASVMARFHILKSREDSTKPPVVIEEESQHEMIDGDHVGSIMERFNILKSREENSKSKSDGLEVEKQLEMTCSTSKCDDETFNEAINPDFLHRKLCPSVDKFESYGGDGVGDGYVPLNEFHLAVNNDPVLNQPMPNSVVNNQTNSCIWRDSSSSSDWEHVHKDDFSWKNM